MVTTGLRLNRPLTPILKGITSHNKKNYVKVGPCQKLFACEESCLNLAINSFKSKLKF